MSLSEKRASWLFFLLSPVIRELLGEALIKIYKKALETPNKFDDLLVKFLMSLVGVDIPDEDTE
jgi:hypothetical protein